MDIATSILLEDGKKEMVDLTKLIPEENISVAKSNTPILFVGDFIVRNLHINKNKAKKEIQKICKPGGNVGGIHETIKWRQIMEKTSTMDPEIVMVHIETNDTGYRQTETMKKTTFF